MREIFLHISNPFAGKQTVKVENELTVGRTDLSDVALPDDAGLSRKNTTFFLDGETLLVVDENSLNGTYLNGEKIAAAPVRVFDGDEIRLGSETTIRVEIKERETKTENQKPKTEDRKPNPKSQIPNRTSPRSF